MNVLPYSLLGEDSTVMALKRNTGGTHQKYRHIERQYLLPNKKDVVLVQGLVEADGTHVVCLANGAREKPSLSGCLSSSKDAPLASKQFSHVGRAKACKVRLANMCAVSSYL